MPYIGMLMRSLVRRESRSDAPPAMEGGVGLKATGFMVQIKKAILRGLRERFPRTKSA
jgi:hypothetical protein